MIDDCERFYLPNHIALRTSCARQINQVPHKLVVDSMMMEKIHHDSYAFYSNSKMR